MQLQDIAKQAQPEQEKIIEFSSGGRIELIASKAIDEEQSFILSLKSSGQSLPGLSDLFGLLGLSMPSDMSWFHHPAEISIRNFSLIISAGEVSHVSVSIGTVHSWNLVNNFLVFEEIVLQGKVMSPQDPDNAMFEMLLRGTIRVGAARINVSVEIPDLLSLARQKKWSDDYDSELRQILEQENDLSSDGEEELNAFIEQFSPIMSVADKEPLSFIFQGEMAEKLNLVVFLKSIGLPAADLHNDLAIEDLKFRYDSGSGAFQFFIDVSNVWKLDLGGGEALKLEDLFFALSHSGESDNTMACEFGARLTFCKMELLLKARCSGADAGWQFEGVLEHAVNESDPKTIDTEEFSNELNNRFGIQLPTTLREGLSLNRIDVSFNTLSRAFTFNCDATLKIEDKVIEALLAIDIEPNGDGFRERFNGHFIVMPSVETSQAPKKEVLFFDLTLEHEVDTTMLMASYQVPDEEAPSLSMDALLGELSGIEHIPPLKIKLRDAYFIHQSSSEKDKSLDLLGLDIDGGLDLAQIKLPDLPLLSGEDLFGADESLRLSFQAIVLSRNIGAKESSEISALLGTHKLTFPDNIKLESPLALNVTLQIGSNVQQLSVPVSINTDADAQGNGLQLVTTTGSEVNHSDAIKTGDGTQWLKIQKSFGPVHMERVGIRFGDDDGTSQVSALLDGGISVAGLSVSLDGLTVKAPLSDLSKFEFSLDGLGIDFKNGPIEIGGAFIENLDANGMPQFSGAALLRMPQLSLSALGVFSRVNNHPSLFIYALLDKIIGGPAFFFVTGLAAGFGYNRSLKVPSIDKVAEFPLVSQVMGGANANSGEAEQAIAKRDPMTQLEALEGYIPPSVGDSFLAIGVRFNSFKTIHSFALLILQFKQRFEIDLLGLSTLSSPPAVNGKGEKQVTPIAYAQLAIKVTFIPDEGTLRARGQLTGDSYVLSRQNHLSGGFALYTWFTDTEETKAGDFVATLGGYHPAYQVPAHYPTVSRLALQWQVNDHFHIKGSAYFALTSQAVMAGGCLEATWQSGDFKAWFNASANFLIAWQPYYYDASVYVEMGADVTIHAFGTYHLGFNGGANVHLWGPEFSGHANVYFKVLAFSVAFDVDFGAGASAPEAIGWDSFKQAFLSDDLCAVSVKNGLLSTLPKDDSTKIEHWVVDPHEVMFNISSLVPVTSLSGTPGNSRLCISPMGLVAEEDADAFVSTIEVFIQNSKHEQITSGFQFTTVKQTAPSALWGKAKIKQAHNKRFVDPPDLNGNSLIEDVVMGLTIKADTPTKPNSSGQMDPDKLLNKAKLHEGGVSWEKSMTTTSKWGLPKSIETVPIQTKRAALLKALKISLANVTSPGNKPANFYGVVQ